MLAVRSFWNSLVWGACPRKLLGGYVPLFPMRRGCKPVSYSLSWIQLQMSCMTVRCQRLECAYWEARLWSGNVFFFALTFFLFCLCSRMCTSHVYFHNKCNPQECVPLMFTSILYDFFEKLLSDIITWLVFAKLPIYHRKVKLLFYYRNLSLFMNPFFVSSLLLQFYFIILFFRFQ